MAENDELQNARDCFEELERKIDQAEACDLLREAMGAIRDIIDSDAGEEIKEIARNIRNTYSKSIVINNATEHLHLNRSPDVYQHYAKLLDILINERQDNKHPLLDLRDDLKEAYVKGHIKQTRKHDPERTIPDLIPEFKQLSAERRQKIIQDLGITDALW